MKKLQLYLETTVWNFQFADDAPEFRDVTKKFFGEVDKGRYDIFISEVVIREIGKADDEKMKTLMALIDRYKPVVLESNEDIRELSLNYITKAAIPANKADDALHAAVATFYQMDALVSWNLKHLASFTRMEKINAVNLDQGYGKRLELITPMEVSDAAF
jgi:predicted nucleic acid-binding protein